MSTITVDMIKELRVATGASLLACKKALEANDGDVSKALDALRAADRFTDHIKPGRKACEGRVASYVHHDGKSGCILELNCESDFVANTPDFAALTHDLCLHIVASRPTYVQRTDVAFDVWKAQQTAYADAVLPNRQTTPEGLKDYLKVKMGEWAAEVCLLNQPFIKNPHITVREHLAERIAKTGENIVVRRFQLFELGDGLEKKDDDFAGEVARLAGE